MTLRLRGNANMVKLGISATSDAGHCLCGGENRRSVDTGRRRHRLGSERVKLSIESANIDATIEDSRRSVYIFTNLQLPKALAILRRKHVHPSRLIAKYYPPIHHWRSSPDWSSHQVLPDNFPLVSGQAVEEAIARSNVDAIILNHRTGPKAASLFVIPAQAAIGFEFPKKLSC